MVIEQFEDIEVEDYNLRDRNIEDIISKHFPQYEAKKREIKYDGIFANITLIPDSAIVTRKKNGILMNLHSTDEKHADHICGDFRLKIKKDGSLVVLKKNFADMWERVYGTKLS